MEIGASGLSGAPAQQHAGTRRCPERDCVIILLRNMAAQLVPVQTRIPHHALYRLVQVHQIIFS